MMHLFWINVWTRIREFADRRLDQAQYLDPVARWVGWDWPWFRL